MSEQAAESSARVIDYPSGAKIGSGYTQTTALLVDAYRDLQSRKLFWLTLFLSGLVALVFGAVGINDKGFTIFSKLIPSPFNTTLIPAGTFYKFMYTQLAIPFWLGFCATVLALVAVAGMYPEMISNGSIDLYLSRPIGRLRLFLTKYVFGLLFAAFQVLLFSTASYFVIGIRGGEWEPKIFLAVPLVTLLFSYLYCICVLVGILTKSALASVLITVLFWAAIYVIHQTDMVLTTLAEAAIERVDRQQQLVNYNQQVIDNNNALPQDQRANVSAFEHQRDAQTTTLREYQGTAEDLRWWQRTIVKIKTPLPKTNETVYLMSRWLVEEDPLLRIQEEEEQRRAERRARRGASTRRAENLGQYADDPEVTQRVHQELTARRVGWIIGSSLGFEAVVLGLGAWVFCRRDY
jgi:ABC-type transport system involved in multi-copper enzyme maturation permease subunit